MNDDTEQSGMQAALAERTARNRARLGLDQPAAAHLSTALLQEQREIRCGCGADFTATVLREGDKEILLPPRCSKCRSAKEEERLQKHQAEQLELLEVRKQRSLSERREQLAVPPLYAGVTLEVFEHHGPPADQALQMRALSFARRYLAQWPDVQAFVVFRGIFGSGKGLVAWSLARAVVELLGGRARVVKLSALICELRASWRKDSEVTYTTALSTWREVDLLVIDEVSRHAFYGEQVHQHLYDVIDHRIEQGRPTILTTNEKDEGLEQILRPALINRLEGHGGIIEFGNASWRSRPIESAATEIQS